jgi:hypothetical protein
MATLESLLPLCRRHAPGCPDFVLIEALRRAAREFCRDSWFARRSIEVQLVAGQGFYDIEPDDEAEEIIGADAAEYQGNPLGPADQKEVPQTTGKPRCWVFLPPATVEFVPYPAEDATDLDVVRVSVIVQPTAAATTVGDDIARLFDEALADGAVAIVCGDEQAAWSSPQLAAKHGQRFYTAKMNAKGKALRAHQPRGLRVQPVRF